MAYIDQDISPSEKRNNELFTLYVSNLPEELNKDGIAQIFQAFGEIRIMSPDNAKWAYVGYKSYKEAEHAIRALNDRGPLFLKVAFQKKKTTQNSQPISAATAVLPPPETPIYRDFRYTEAVAPHNRRFIPAMVGAQIARYPSYNHEADANSVYPIDIDHDMYNPFESVGRYADTNAMWSRGCMNVDAYGKRYVSLGRAFTRYHIPEPPRNQEQQIGRIYENRRAGLYEFGEDRLRSRVGKCQFCTRVTTLYCEQCGGFYCSRDCQVSDWPRHKMECRTIPSLVGGIDGGIDGGTLSRSSSDDQLHVPRKPGGLNFRGVKSLRRPKEMTKKRNNPSILSSEELAKENENQREITTKDKPAPPIIDLTFQTPDKNSSQNFRYDEEMKKGTNVTSNDRKETIKEMEKRRYDENSNDRQKPNYRSQSSSKSEQNGFKNSERIGRENERSFNKNNNFQSSRECYNSNSSSKGVQPKVGSSEEITDKTKKCFVQMDEDLLFAKPQKNIENEKTQQISSSTSLEIGKKTETIESLFSKNNFTDVAVVFPMADGTFWAHRKIDVAKIEELMQQLHIKVPNYPKATKFVIGEMYAVKYNDLWHRATLVSINPPIIFYVDFGNEEPPQSEEFRLLNDFPIYPNYAIRMRLTADAEHQKISEDSEFSVKMIKVDKDGIVEVAIDKSPKNSSPERKNVSPQPKNSSSEPSNTTTTNTVKISPAVVESPVKKAEFPVGKIQTSGSDKKTPEVVSTTPNASKIVGSATSNNLKVSETISETNQISKERINASEEKISKKSTIKLSSTIESLEANVGGMLQVYMALNDNSFAVCCLNPILADEYEMIYEKLTETCAAMTKPTNFEPKIGDFVCGKREDFWLRGCVFSIGPPIRLTLVDEARISVVESVLPMPPEYEKICTFGLICTFDNPGFTLNIDDTPEFTVTTAEIVAGERIVKAVITNPAHLKDAKITLKNWNPTPEQKGIGFAELKSNSEVCITAYTNERIMFVRSLDTESQERTHRITQNVAKWAQKAPKLDGSPAIGQLVIAKFIDGNFYRAIVTKIENEKIGVSYVDYGNRDFVKIDDLRVLSDELKEQKSCAAKIVLKDIKTDVPPTEQVHKYLNLLVGKEQALFCTFEGIPSKDGVILTTVTGECVNLKVNELLTPSWKREDPSKDTNCYMDSQLEYAKLGEVGETRQAFVLYGSEAPLEYFMSPYDVEHIRHVTQIMPKMLDEYCKSTDKHYIPRAKELCLAVYEDAWYRGLCLNPSVTPTQAKIHFIDFGNVEIVNHVDIRQMTKDFMSPAALACMCEIKNLGIELVDGDIPSNIKMRLDDLIPLNDLVHVKILEKIEEGAVYVLELPQVRQQLLQEGLVK